MINKIKNSKTTGQNNKKNHCKKDIYIFWDFYLKY